MSWFLIRKMSAHFEVSFLALISNPHAKHQHLGSDYDAEVISAEGEGTCQRKLILQLMECSPKQYKNQEVFGFSICYLDNKIKWSRKTKLKIKYIKKQDLIKEKKK
jgi:hypothetical protein